MNKGKLNIIKSFNLNFRTNCSIKSNVNTKENIVAVVKKKGDD